jgi:hypothetical protein
VDPVPDPLLLRKSGSAGNRTRQLTTQFKEVGWAVVGEDPEGSCGGGYGGSEGQGEF